MSIKVFFFFCFREIHDETFIGLPKIDFLSLADNELTEFPRGILVRMPGLKSLDIGRGHITQILEHDFAVRNSFPTQSEYFLIKFLF